MLDVLLEVLNDGRYHTIHEIAEKLHENEVKTAVCITFLHEFGFVVSSGLGVLLNEKVKEFLVKIKEIEL